MKQATLNVPFDVLRDFLLLPEDIEIVAAQPAPDRNEIVLKLRGEGLYETRDGYSTYSPFGSESPYLTGIQPTYREVEAVTCEEQPRRVRYKELAELGKQA